MQYFTSLLYVFLKRLLPQNRTNASSTLSSCAFIRLFYIAAFALLFNRDVLEANDNTLNGTMASSVPEQFESTFWENVTSLEVELNYDIAITPLNSKLWLKRSTNNFSYKSGLTKTTAIPEKQYKKEVILHVRKPRDLEITATPTDFKPQNSHSSVFQGHHEEHYASLVPHLNTTTSILNSIPVSTVKG